MSSGNTHTHIGFFYLCLLIQIRWFKSCITARWLVSDLHSLLESSFVTPAGILFPVFSGCWRSILKDYSWVLHQIRKKQKEEAERPEAWRIYMSEGNSLTMDFLQENKTLQPGKTYSCHWSRKTTEFKKSRQLQCAKYAKMSQNEIHSCLCG